MADWSKRFDASYRFMRVSRKTGLEMERLRNLKNGGYLSRNSNTAVFESGQVEYVGALDLGADFMRVYLDADFGSGKESVALGTYLATVEDVDVNGGVRSGKAKLYGLLKLLQDDDFDGPYALEAGANAVEEARKICESVGLSVIADDSDWTLSTAWVFGIGGVGDDRPDSKLAAVNKLLDAAGFRSAMTDPTGRVLLRRYVEPSGRQPSFAFEEGRNARFFARMTDSTNVSEVANVVHVDYSTQEYDVRGAAVDDDPTSRYSTVNVGRRIVKTYSYDDLPDGTTEEQAQASADAKAAELLRNERSVRLGLSWESVYQPVAVTDAVKMNYASGGIDRVAVVQSQRLSMNAGCTIEYEGRTFER